MLLAPLRIWECVLYPGLRIGVFLLAVVVLLILLRWGYTLPSAVTAVSTITVTALAATTRLLLARPLNSSTATS